MSSWARRRRASNRAQKSGTSYFFVGRSRAVVNNRTHTHRARFPGVCQTACRQKQPEENCAWRPACARPAKRRKRCKPLPAHYSLREQRNGYDVPFSLPNVPFSLPRKRVDMPKIFHDFDLTNFWEDSDYARKKYVEIKPTSAMIASIEKELGFRLPASY